MKLLTALKRHLFITLGNTLPMYGPFNRMRASMFRKAGMTVGSGVTIIGPLSLELSLNEETLGGISIGDNAYLNAGTRLACRNSRISIGDDVQIGPRVSFETATHGIVYEPDLGRGLDHHEIRVGDKVWIGNGTWCGVMTVMANVCDRKGVPIEMAAFTVRTDRPGVTPGEELLSMGMRGMVQSKVSLRDVDVEPADVLGEPGEGLMVGVDSMMFTRFALGACAVGAMKRSLQLIQRFASRRSIASGRLLDSPVTLAFAGELVAKTAAADALLYTIADLLDAGSAVPLEALVAVKLVSSEFLWQAADRLVQILGSRGYDEANLAPQLLRDARVFRIFEGPTEALAEFLGSRALLDDSPGVYGFLRDELGSPELADRLAACVEQLRARPLDPRVPLSPNLEHAWRCALAGDAVAWAFLAGSLARRAGRTPTPRQRRVLDWTRLAFAAAVQRAVEGDLTQAAIDPADELGRAIEDYGDAIGVVDQTLAGESRQIDPLLREPAGG